MDNVKLKPQQPKSIRFADGKYKGKTLEEVYDLDYPWLVATANKSHPHLRGLILEGINQIVLEKESARGKRDQDATV